MLAALEAAPMISVKGVFQHMESTTNQAQQRVELGGLVNLALVATSEVKTLGPDQCKVRFVSVGIDSEVFVTKMV